MLTTYYTTPAVPDGATALFYISKLELEPNEPLPAVFNTLASHCYTLFWTGEGSGNIWTGLLKTHLQPGSFFCVKAGQGLKPEPATVVKGYIIFFQESFLGLPASDNGWDISYILPQLLNAGPLNTGRGNLYNKVAAVFEKMIAEYREEERYGNEVLQLYLKILLLKLSRTVTEEMPVLTPAKRHSVVEKFFRLLEKDQGSKMQVKDYARLLHVTPNYLNETVKQRTGYPAGYHVRQRIVLEAKKMIAYSGLCSKEIAYTLGFWDIAHFSRFFKTNAGMNVSEFRNGLLSGLGQRMAEV